MTEKARSSPAAVPALRQNCDCYVTSSANVAIVARRQETLDAAKDEIETHAAKTANSGKVMAISADIRQDMDCVNAVEKTCQAFGQVDILVNNAGTSQRGDFLEISDALWQDDLDLKLLPLFACHDK